MELYGRLFHSLNKFFVKYLKFLLFEFGLNHYLPAVHEVLSTYISPYNVYFKTVYHSTFRAIDF